MKKPTAIAFVIALSFFALLDVSAQEATFNDETLYALIRNSKPLMEGKRMRFVTIKEEFEDEGKTFVSSTKSTNEILPPDRSRLVYETKTPRGAERVEHISIGERRFVRRNGGEWEILTPSGGGMGSGIGNGSGDIPQTETTTVRTLTKNVIVNDQKTDWYKSVVSVKFIFPTRTYTNIYTESYWFDADGRMIRSASESKYGDTKTVSRQTESYEYNPNLKIEAPIIKRKTKPASK